MLVYLQEFKNELRRDVDIQTAHLICRMQYALVDEGIGPKDPQDTDRAIIYQAGAMVLEAGLMSAHRLWDAYIINQETHKALCNCGLGDGL